jgi:tetratricopeptide (TPR) repeat protein
LHRAIELDPTLAEAYAWLSYAIVLSMLYFDVEPDDERLNQAVILARKGVELDEQDALTHFAYGRALLAGKAYQDALAELEAAADLNPSLAVVYCGLGDSLAYEGRSSMLRGSSRQASASEGFAHEDLFDTSRCSITSVVGTLSRPPNRIKPMAAEMKTLLGGARAILRKADWVSC